MFKAFDDLEDDIRKAREAHDLLERVWSWYGPYGPDGGEKDMPPMLVSELRRFFDFDDSE